MYICVCVHSGILLSYKKNEIISFAATYLQLGASQMVQCRRCPSLGFDPWVRKINHVEAGTATHSVVLSGESHGQRSLEGYSPGAFKESNTTEGI